MAAAPANIGVNCAFPGINQNLGQTFFLFPIGRAVYNALQMKLAQNVANPVKGVKAVNFQIAYSLWSYKNSGGACGYRNRGGLGSGLRDPSRR